MINEENDFCSKIDTYQYVSHYRNQKDAGKKNQKDVFEKVSISNGYTKEALRDLIVSEECNSRTHWLLETGYAIREQSVFEAHKNYTTCVKNTKNGVINHFDLKFKQKKSPSWTINLDKSNIKIYDIENASGFSLYEESGIMKITEKIHEDAIGLSSVDKSDIEFAKREEKRKSIQKDSYVPTKRKKNDDIKYSMLNHNCKIHFDGEHYYILIAHDIQKRPSKSKQYFCSLDPGSRKFQTLYSPEYEAINIGERASDKLYALLLNLDEAISKKNIKLQKKLRNRIKHLQKELHDKVSRFLCQNYHNIYIPKLTKENDIISKKTKKIKTKTVRQMVVLGHCKFVEKLKTKASDYTDVRVNVITEEYTSQICAKCSRLTKTSNETYKCQHCLFEIDRDLLGSRNILLKSWNLLNIQKC